MQTFEKYFNRVILQEGGAAGHMLHPYELDRVHTGDDLVHLFNQVVASIKMEPVPVKIDGINASFKYLKDKQQFALDRGSMKPEDVQGITIDNISQRFGESHGFVEKGKRILQILNSAIPSIQEEIKELGLLDPNRFINAEYVDGQTNVLGYTDRFLALHNVSEFRQATSKRREGIVIPFNKQVLKNFASKLDIVAKKFGFRVYQEFVAKIVREPDFKKVLEEPITIKVDKEHKFEKPLGKWLLSVKKPLAPIKFDIYKRLILNSEPLTSITHNVDDYDNLTAAAIIYHATRVLGRELLNSMESDIGPVSQQEGVVIPNVADKPFKITGDFMINRLSSPFQK